MKKIQNPYKMKWAVGTKVVYCKAPTLKTQQMGYQITCHDKSVLGGAVMEVMATFNSAIPYADLEEENGTMQMVDLRDLKKV